MPDDFADLGSRSAVDLALHRLVAANDIRRIARGLYDAPTTNRLTGNLTVSNCTGCGTGGSSSSGVSSIIAGSGISVSSATGTVTVSATGGGSASPLIVGGVVTSTIYGDASSTFIANFDGRYQFPTPTQLAATGCNGSSTITDATSCLAYLYKIAPSSTEIDIGPPTHD
jgi:hypothetical protein